MTSELIMKSSVLDIVFESRNKEYGAYRLRKFYNKRLMKSIALMMVVVVVFSAFTFLPDHAKPVVFTVEDAGFANPPVDAKQPVAKPKLPKPELAKAMSTIHLSNAIIIVNNKDSVDVLHNLDDKAIGSKNNDVPGDKGGALIAGAGDGSGGNSIEPVKAVEKPVDINKPVDNPDVMPSYPGGMEALRRFLIKNLSNPRDLEEGELISVKVKFVVSYDGAIKGFELVEDGGTEFNTEVMRVLKKMPVWVPGKLKGQNVPVYYIIPVKFVPEG